ncbi:hypothetical protein J2Z76_000484 [Sedimentibacter acidaminivorans]|uniref:Uncharacterized protein n=1 Tax=Sedimentibacter acidaminivorans TaxID=913099 RepID=A0ABS4GAB9_9FIRM|nr:hypothetical protein [Sedimentibacter acidaminivorans]MBP1924631.1 hypothetical protein [Sedimentibacter acidaminivorans]
MQQKLKIELRKKVKTMEDERIEIAESTADKIVELLLNSKTSYSEVETILRVVKFKITNEVIIRP